VTWRVSAGAYLGTVVYHLQGDLDETAIELHKELTTPADEGRFLFDLTGIQSVDSSGLAGLLQSIRSIHDHDGRIALAAGRPEVIEVLRAGGLDRLVYLAETPLEAFGWLSLDGDRLEPPVPLGSSAASATSP
jgi:anti-anti-sigma factor